MPQRHNVCVHNRACIIITSCEADSVNDKSFSNFELALLVTTYSWPPNNTAEGDVIAENIAGYIRSVTLFAGYICSVALFAGYICGVALFV